MFLSMTLELILSLNKDIYERAPDHNSVAFFLILLHIHSQNVSFSALSELTKYIVSMCMSIGLRWINVYQSI